VPTKPTALRKVRFSLIPTGAHLLLDGREVSWFGRTFELEPGPHPVRITLPPGTSCCKPRGATATIEPAHPDRPDEVQVIVLKAEPRPATVTLVGAPPEGRFVCLGINLSGGADVPVRVTLPQPTWTGQCQLSPKGGSPTVTLRAGEHNRIAWQGP